MISRFDAVNDPPGFWHTQKIRRKNEKRKHIYAHPIWTALRQNLISISIEFKFNAMNWIHYRVFFCEKIFRLNRISFKQIWDNVTRFEFPFTIIKNYRRRVWHCHHIIWNRWIWRRRRRCATTTTTFHSQLYIYSFNIS